MVLKPFYWDVEWWRCVHNGQHSWPRLWRHQPSVWCIILSAPLYLQCYPSPKTLIEDQINRPTWYGVDVNVPLNSCERYHWCKSHCNAPIGKGVWPRCCNGCLSSLINVHHFSLPLLLLVLTCKCPPLLLLQPLTPTPTADKTMHTDSLVISKSPPAPNLRLHNTENQIQIQLLLLLIPRKIVPTPKGVNQLRTLSRSKPSDFISSVTSRSRLRCFLSGLQFVVSCQFCPIFCGHLTSLLFPTVSHLAPYSARQTHTNTNIRQQMSPLWATWQYHQWTAKKKGVTLHTNAY